MSEPQGPAGPPAHQPDAGAIISLLGEGGAPYYEYAALLMEVYECKRMPKEAI